MVATVLVEWMNFALEKRKLAHRGKEEKEGGHWSQSLRLENGVCPWTDPAKDFSFSWILGTIIFNAQLFGAFYLWPNFQWSALHICDRSVESRGKTKCKHGFLASSLVLVFCCWCNTFLQTKWLKDTTVLLSHWFRGQRTWNPGVSKAVFLLEAWGENLFSCIFQLLKTTCAPWSLLISLWPLFLSPHLIWHVLSRLLFSLMGPVITQIIQDDLPISKSLI